MNNLEVVGSKPTGATNYRGEQPRRCALTSEAV